MIEHDPVIQPIQVVSCPVCQKQMEVRQVEGTHAVARSPDRATQDGAGSGDPRTAVLEDWPSFPFCSPRCKLIDLGRWLGEDYSLPESDPAPSPSEDPAI